MKKYVALLIGIIVILGGGYVVLGYTGVIQSPFTSAPTYLSSNDISEIDISLLLAFITDVDLSQIEQVREELDIHIYGINDDDASTIVAWYETENARNGWSPLRQSDTWKSYSGHGYNAYLRAWNRMLMGQIVIVGGGSRVKSTTGYDVVVITSTAPILTYESYFN